MDHVDPREAAHDDVLRRFSRNYGVVESWETSLARLRAHPLVVDARDREFPNAQRFDFEGLHGRAWSSSYVFRGVEDRPGFDAALRLSSTSTPVTARCGFPYRAAGIVFRVAKASSGP